MKSDWAKDALSLHPVDIGGACLVRPKVAPWLLLSLTRAKEMNFATLPCLREVAMSHPEGNFSSLMCLEERCELLQLACPFLCQEPRREGIDRHMQRSGLLSTQPWRSQLSLASCHCSALFPWERMVPLSLGFAIKSLPVRIRPVSFFKGLEGFLRWQWTGAL